MFLATFHENVKCLLSILRKTAYKGKEVGLLRVFYRRTLMVCVSLYGAKVLWPGCVRRSELIISDRKVCQVFWGKKDPAWGEGLAGEHQQPSSPIFHLSMSKLLTSLPFIFIRRKSPTFQTLINNHMLPGPKRLLQHIALPFQRLVPPSPKAEIHRTLASLENTQIIC